MRRSVLKSRCFAALLALSPLSSFAMDYSVGDLTISQPWSRATPKGASVAAGYLAIHNNGAAMDRLIGVETDAAGVAQIHEMTMDGDVMKMRELPNGLEIAPGASVELKPGGYHIMFLNPTRPFVAGDKIGATLTFEHAGKARVEFLVGAIGGGKPMDMPAMDQGAMDQGAMDHGSMDHGAMPMGK